MTPKAQVAQVAQVVAQVAQVWSRIAIKAIARAPDLRPHLT